MENTTRKKQTKRESVSLYGGKIAGRSRQVIDNQYAKNRLRRDPTYRNNTINTHTDEKNLIVERTWELSPTSSMFTIVSESHRIVYISCLSKVSSSSAKVLISNDWSVRSSFYTVTGHQHPTPQHSETTNSVVCRA